MMFLRTLYFVSFNPLQYVQCVINCLLWSHDLLLTTHQDWCDVGSTFTASRNTFSAILLFPCSCNTMPYNNIDFSLSTYSPNKKVSGTINNYQCLEIDKITHQMLQRLCVCRIYGQSVLIATLCLFIFMLVFKNSPFLKYEFKVKYLYTFNISIGTMKY